MLNNPVRRIVSVVLIAAIFIFMTINTSAYAQTAPEIARQINADNIDAKVSIIGTNKVKIVDGDTTGTITVIEDTPEIRKVLISSSDEQEDIILTTDKIAQTITSSKTNETISIEKGAIY